MTDNTQPLALMLADRLHHDLPTVLRIDAEHAGEELRRQHARIAELEDRVQELGAMARENRSRRIVELEAQLEAVGAGGVQALSAAPAGWKAVPVNPTPEMWKAAKSVPDPNPPYPPHYGLVWDAMLAASPTPTSPAEQQAAPKALSQKEARELNRLRTMEFAFHKLMGKHGLHPGRTDDDLFQILDAHLQDRGENAIGEVVIGEGPTGGAWNVIKWREDAPQITPGMKLYAAPQQEAQEPCPTCAALARTVMLDQVSFDRKPDCYGIRQITDDEAVEEWEDIRTSPDVAREEANDMMETGRGEIYEVVPLWTTPQPSLTAKAADSVLEDAARLDWLALAGPVSICVAIDRPHDGEVEVSTDDVTGYGKTLREAIDAALAAQGGK